MTERAALAVEKKMNGMNCAQAVACAFCDLAGIDEDTMARITQTLGTGVGATLEGSCGAVNGAAIALGLIGKDKTRMENTKLAGELVRKFIEMNGAVTCKALKGVETGKVLRSCIGCVEDAAALLEEILSR